MYIDNEITGFESDSFQCGISYTSFMLSFFLINACDVTPTKQPIIWYCPFKYWINLVANRSPVCTELFAIENVSLRQSYSIALVWVWTSVSLLCQQLASQCFGATSRHMISPIRACSCGSRTAVSLILYVLGTNSKWWNFACWKAPSRMGWSIEDQQRRLASGTNARNWSRYWISHHGSTCTLPWMSYTSGDLLSVGAISGGIPLMGPLHSSKVTHGDQLALGYYNTKPELVYYQLGGVHTKTSIEILALLSAFPVISAWSYPM